MSSITTLARPYAKAAFGLARDAGGTDSWLAMLELASNIATDAAVASVLKNPLVSTGQAIELMTQSGGENFDERFNGFIKVLGANRRLPLLPEIHVLFRGLKLAAEQRLQVRVVAARALEENQTARLRDALTRRFNCEIEIDSEIDPGILAGAVIYAGDQVIDGSLRGRLQKLSAALNK